MATIMITGGSGFVGRHLADLLLKSGDEVIILSRTARYSNRAGLTYAKWDPASRQIDQEALSRTDHIIHLAGAGVADKRWTEARKQEILDSRTSSSDSIVQALKAHPNKVRSVISASAIGWYGADTPESRKSGFTEDAPADTHFLGETCRQWEAHIEPVTALGKRLVCLRIGIVLSPDGGALKEFARPLQFGFATIMGTGSQVISWLHVDDLCRMFKFAIDHPELSGAYNAVAPTPVTNKELVLTLGAAKRGKAFLPVHVPSFMLKLMLGEMSVEILKSATVSSRKIQQAGFQFLYPNIKAALHLK